MRESVGRMGRVALVALLASAALPAALDAQTTGRVTGTVTDATTLAPLASAQVYLTGTSYGSLSNNAGSFLLDGVPPGTYVVVAQRIGFQETRSETITVAAGATTSVSLSLNPAVLALQGIVATGMVDPVEGVRAPIAVARVDRELMPVVASGGAVQNLQGRVAGLTINRSSGQPGEGTSIMLRTPTSINGGGAPLIVVDGVILGGSGSTVDIESMDIESIEVIRGAAASSLYGSRAAAGVISITTARGTSIPTGQTRFTARTEYGVSQNLRNIALNNSHHFLMDPTNSYYVDANGNEVSRANRVAPPLAVAFQDKPYPDPLYDNVGAITRPGGFMNSSFSVAGNTESTNFAVTLARQDEEGSLRNNEGYARNSFRVNLDHRFRDALGLSVSMYHARDNRDNIPSSTSTTGGQGNPFNDALRAPRDVDFARKDENGNYLQQPDPAIAYQNPLWTQATRENEQWGTRTLANIGLNWNPLPWITASTSVGYDRSDNEQRAYVPKGTPLNVGTAGESDGSLYFSNSLRDTWNAEAQVTARYDLGDLNVRTTVRGLMERDRSESGTRSGQNFILVDVPQLSNVRDLDRNATSTEQETRALGYLWDTAFDYAGRYIFTVLGRRDGSSLFGPDNRWHTYYRVAGAWRIAEEPWFDVPGINELKLSFARGTAGGRPSFQAQYETWSLSGGVPTKGTLGNTQLAPEHTTENEFSLNMVLNNRIGIVLTHARQETRDQIVAAPLANFAGYSSQWINAGTITGHTTELEVEARLIENRGFSWTSLIVADFKNSRIKEWPIACQTPGWRYNCTGEPVYGLYSWWLVKDHAGLRKHRGGEAWEHRDEFQVNDEGFLVWVGEGNNYWEGMEKGLWGTESGLIGGRTYQWGHPFPEQDVAGNNLRQLMGEGSSTNLGWINNFTIRGVRLHSQFQAAIGGQANNRNHQQMTNTATATAPRMDQAGKPDGLKKPIAYFRSANDGDASYYVEDASYLKLRTLAVSYEFGAESLQRVGLGGLGISSLAVGLTGRNLFTVTHYEGFDPEQALDLNTRANTDAGSYPPTRNFTADITLTF